MSMGGAMDKPPTSADISRSRGVDSARLALTTCCSYIEIQRAADFPEIEDADRRERD